MKVVFPLPGCWVPRFLLRLPSGLPPLRICQAVSPSACSSVGLALPWLKQAAQRLRTH